MMGFDRLQLLGDRLRGRKTTIEMSLPGEAEPFRMAVSHRRELRRIREASQEEVLLRRIAEHIEPGDLCYDVGANIGTVSLFMGRRTGPEGQVFAFEPAPPNFERLIRNIALNGLSGRVSAESTALGSVDGEAVLHLRGEEAGEGRHSIAVRKASTSSLQVTLRTMASFATERSAPPDFVKIDVEGAEGEVLKGAAPLLEVGRPRDLILEIHPKGGGDRMPSGELIRAWLEKRGMTLAWEGCDGSRLHQHYRR